METSRRTFLVVSLGLLCATLAVYAQTLGHTFLLYDDDLYVTANRTVQQGLTAKGVAWAFTTRHAGNWHPVTWLSHMADVELFGPWAGGHHATNVVLHAANSVLLLWFLASATGSLWRSGFVAALFAVHPAHVESVAWVAERKDVLCAFFWMLTFLAYLRYVRGPSVLRYLTVVACFAFGLATKAMIVTLPFLLLLLDYWPLRRFSGEATEGGASSSSAMLILEKVPLVAMSAFASWMTLWAQSASGALPAFDRLPLSNRLANAVLSVAGYLGKAVWPSSLAVFYPHPDGAYEVWRLALSSVVLVAATVLAVRERVRRPYLLTGWFWYLGTLVPVLGIVQSGSQAMADRWTYVPLLGVFVAVAWGVPDLFRPSRWKDPLLAGLAAVVLLSLAAAAWVQAANWRNSVTLFSHTVAVTRDNWLAQMNLGVALGEEGRTEEEIGHYREAVRIRPAYPEALYNLGAALAQKGDLDGAIESYRRSLALWPGNPQAHLNLGLALAGKGDAEGAERHYREALRLHPDFPLAHSNLGTLLALQGQLDEAIPHFREAVRISPSDPMGRRNLGLALLREGKREEAAEQFREALRLRPGDSAARDLLEAALRQERK